jgi:uncharacterized DUF497 family protein
MAVHPSNPDHRWPAIAGFDWDAGNSEKCRKHGVSLAAIEAMFHRPVALYRDPAHSRDEERFKAIGKADDGRSMVIVFTLRQRAGESFVRSISARYMHVKEIANYEEEAAKTGQR